MIGGGAAGFFGAIACAEAHPHTQVILLEAGRQLLAKVRISGGGRCNVTHACFDPALVAQNYPRGNRALRGPLSRFQPRHTVEWFAAHGVKLKTEADGRMFPVTDNSETIIDCLIQAAQQAGVKIRTEAPVAKISKLDTEFVVQLKSGEELRCDRLLLTTGSNPQGYQIAKNLGHKVEPPVPSLFTFNVLDSQLRELAGVAADPVHLRLLVSDNKPLEQTGPLLITHWGLSGPAVLKLSAWGARILYGQSYQATLRVNWLPQHNGESLHQALLSAKAESPRKAIAANPISLSRRLWQYLCDRAGIGVEKRWAELSKKDLNQLVAELTQGRYPIQGKGIFKDEFVTCGGVSLKEVDFKTLESRCCSGLYFAGEILDIDGITGGFNFQNAWTTAWLAGQAIGHLQ